MSPPAPPLSISLRLVSHTNAGKTTLARTLLGRDVGVVRDAPHVTEFSDAHALVETAAGDRLLLWDTPGFGDSARLVRRLRQAGNPIGWFMSQVWDRWRDRPFWAAQQAMKNVRDEADVLLYLVNAAEAPEAAGYVEPEMELLGWVGKPVVVLLNQLGAPRGAALEAEDVEHWRQHLARHPQVREVLPLDAFARCWVQEATLLDAIAAMVADDPARRRAMAALRGAWWQGRLAIFDSAMAAIATHLATIAVDIEPVGEAGPIGARLARAGGTLGRRLNAAVAAAVGKGRGAIADLAAAAGAAGSAANRAAVAASSAVTGADRVPDVASAAAEAQRPSSATAPAVSSRDDGPVAMAQRALAARLDAQVRAATTALIRLHGLEGRAGGDALAGIEAHFDARLAVGEGRAALWGGALSGALAGLKADLLAGGLTLGGGLLAGGVLGALGGAGVARSVNLLRGTEGSSIGWRAAALDAVLEAMLLRYLAVAHFGRGRGAWAEGEAVPPHWRDAVQSALEPHREALAGVWQARGGVHDARDGGADRPAAPRLEAVLGPLIAAAAADTLQRLYPGTPPLRESAQAPRRPSGVASPP